jgi:hypothetical protein
MKAYWDNDGKPLEDGRLRFVTDLEDGSNPIYTYGKDKDEVLAKLARTNAHAQLTIARRPAPAAQPESAKPAIVPPRRPAMNADEVMQTVTDLQNPAKAGKAAVKLIENETGINFQERAMQDYVRMGIEWEDETPEFYGHPGNRELLAAYINKKIGGKLSLVTKAIFTEVFNELRGQGLLFEAPEPQNSNVTTLTVHPDETPATSTERPRRRFATTSRVGSPAPQTMTRTLKYTEEQILHMPLAKSRRLLETNDKDYAEACEFYLGQARATA